MCFKRWLPWVAMVMIVITVTEARARTGGASAKDNIPAANLEEPRGKLNLSQALALAFQFNPALAISDGAIRVGEARIMQARLLPNPELSAEAENVWGRDAYSGFDEAENTFRIDQPLELGGKRSKRVSLADTERHLAEWDHKARRLEIAAEVTKSFIGVLSGQRRLEVQREIVRLAEAFAATAAARVEAGKVSPIELTRAEIVVASSRNTMRQAEKELDAERKKLASLWGSPDPTFAEAAGNLDRIAPMPSLESLVALLPQSPLLARWETELAQREASLALEKARRIPDLTLSGGLRYFSGTGDEAYVVGLGIPLPIFNRNQGSILEASLLQDMAGKEKTAEEMIIRRELAEFYRDLSNAYETALALRERILPAAQTAFEAVEEGYRRGKFSYLDVLDAQRTLFEAREQEVETLAAFHTAKAELEGIVGESLAILQTNEMGY